MLHVIKKFVFVDVGSSDAEISVTVLEQKSTDERAISD